MAKVIVKTPKEGLEVVKKVIVINPNKRDYGSITLESSSFINKPGESFINRQKRVCFISSDIETLEAMVDEYNLTPECDYSIKTKVNHCLIVKEQTEPFYDGQEPKKNPDTNEELSTADGQTIYRQTFLAVTGTDKDVLLQHVGAKVNAEEKKATVPEEFAE